MRDMTAPAEDGRAAAPAPAAPVKRRVFVASATGVLAMAAWAALSPVQAAGAIGGLVGWTSEWFGWFYVLLATAVLVFVVGLALSRYGHVRLGPDDSRPQYGTASWAAMLFAAGIGTDIMFFAVAEPVTQYLAPPVGEGGTVEAAREATAWTLFHYGLSGWGLYALMGMALAYACYRLHLPLAIRSALAPLFGRRVAGPVGDAVDVAAVLGTIFGVATSLGIGVVQLNFGLSLLFGVPEGRAAQLGLILLAVGMATLSAVSGVDRGIRWLSLLNVALALGLAAFVLLAGRTAFLLNGLVLNVGDFVATFPGRALQTFAYDPPVEWMNAWTLFFWAWWIAWASFVGLFLARISRGRTIRQFVAGTLLIPFSYVLVWISIFGNSAIDRVRSGDAAFGELAVLTPERGFYTLLQDYPAFPVVAGVATFVGLLFYVTSADSGALVMAYLSSDLRSPDDDSGAGVRIFWGVATGLLTAAMLLVGGVPALQSATIVIGLPFAFVVVLVMVGLLKALREDPAAARVLVPAASAATSDWRARLRRAVPAGGEAHLRAVLLPALEEVAAELRAGGARADVSLDGGRSVLLTADLGGPEPFAYRAGPGPVPREVLLDDVLAQVERHVERDVLEAAPALRGEAPAAH